MTLLAVTNLQAAYGAVRVLHGIDFHVGRGEFVALLGANGAGKTTTLRALSGVLPSSGEIRFMDDEMRRTPAADRVRRGLTHVPQGRGTFVDFTVRENLELGAFCVNDRARMKRNIDKWFTTFPRLAQRRNQIAGSLSGGEQQMLAVARALMSDPQLLLCDEPSLGLAPAITHDLFATLKKLNKDEGIAILMVEQNANLTLPIADRAYVLETGSIAVSGMAADLLADPAVQEAYLGVVA